MVVAAALVLAAAGLPGAVHATAADQRTSHPTASPQVSRNGAWTETPGSPIPGGYGATSIWNGQRFLVFGGHVGNACPPAADCGGIAGTDVAVQAAAFDPRSGRWQTIASPTVPGSPTSVVTVRGVTYALYVPLVGLTDAVSVLLAYDPAMDRWLPRPSPPGASPRLLDAGGVLVSIDSRSETDAPAQDAVADPTSGAWRRLPTDPLGASENRAGVWTGRQLVLSAVEGRRAADDAPHVRLAALNGLHKTARWGALGGAGIVSARNQPIAVAPSLLVWPESGVGQFGRARLPLGGTFDLKSKRGSRFPAGLRALAGSLIPDGLRVAGAVTVSGAVFDPVTRAWRKLPLPPGAADVAPAWAAGDLFVFKYGGAHDNGAGTGARAHVPRNYGFLLDGRSLFGA